LVSSSSTAHRREAVGTIGQTRNIIVVVVVTFILVVVTFIVVATFIPVVVVTCDI